MKRLSSVFIIIILIATSTICGSAASALPPAVPSKEPMTQAPKRLLQTDGRELSLAEALKLIYTRADLVGFAFAWDDTYSEFYFEPRTSHDQAEAILSDKVREVSGGLAPKVLWLLGEPSTSFEELSSVHASARNGTLPPSLHRYHASALASVNERRKMEPARTLRPQVSPTWKPNYASARGEFASSVWKVTTEVTWDNSTSPGPTSPRNIPSDHGFEATLWVNNDGTSGRRENAKDPCVATIDLNEDYPGAFNGNLGSLDLPLMVTFSTARPQNQVDLGVYLDWWSDDDRCWHKNYDYGIANPQLLQSVTLGGSEWFSVGVEIQTRRGRMPAGPATGYFQLVRDSCPLNKSTLCMDINPSTLPQDERFAAFLGGQRAAFFPGRMQWSANLGVFDYETFSPRSTAFGDSTGDGTGDLLFLRGLVFAYQGGQSSGLSSMGSRGAPFVGTVKSVTKVVDLSGDGYSDYLYTSTHDDSLHVLLGGPKGTVSRAVSGWGEQGYTDLAVGDGWAGMRVLGGCASASCATKDLYGITPDGQLKHYPLVPGRGSNGQVTLGFGSIGVKGTGWQSIKSATRINWDGDSDWDILAVSASGDLLLYTVQDGAIIRVNQVGRGWTAYDISNGGDFTGDRRDDLIARHSDGRLFVYPFTGSGWGAPIQIGTGFHTDPTFPTHVT